MRARIDVRHLSSYIQAMNTSEKLSALLELGLSQWEISRETNISQATISRILDGKQKNPKESTVSAIAALYTKAKRRKRAA